MPIEQESNGSMNDSVHLVVPSFKGHRPVPTYPSQALSMQHQGNVIVRVLIGVQGEVIDAQIHQSSGSEWLDHAAKKASLRAKFYPYVRNGVALNSTVDLPFNFVIKR
ncbi:MAG: energy transducer TonB [Sheuella sp.]|nr:energy transducer TonB [Sheuella sp.]